MSGDPKKLLYDVAAACAAIEAFCRGRSLADYESELMLRSACERQFEIIGEAMSRLRDGYSTTFAKIPNSSAIIAFGNRLIHGCDTVDLEIVWDVVQTKLPGLDRAVRAMLGQDE